MTEFTALACYQLFVVVVIIVAAGVIANGGSIVDAISLWSGN